MIMRNRFPTIIRSSLPLVVLLAFLGAFITGRTVPAQSRPPYSSTQPIQSPLIFGDGIISTGDDESHPAFTPDGQTLYFLKNTPLFNHWTIVISHYANGKWGTPTVAPFSGQYSDADPFITSDGRKLFFISTRPVDGKSKQDTELGVGFLTKTHEAALAAILAGSNDYDDLQVVYYEVEHPENETEQRFKDLWEITGFIASDGFEWLFEQSWSFDDFVSIFTEIGFTEALPILEKVRELIPDGIRTPDREEEMYNRIRASFEPLKQLLHAYILSIGSRSAASPLGK